MRISPQKHCHFDRGLWPTRNLVLCNKRFLPTVRNDNSFHIIRNLLLFSVIPDRPPVIPDLIGNPVFPTIIWIPAFAGMTNCNSVPEPAVPEPVEGSKDRRAEPPRNQRSLRLSKGRRAEGPQPPGTTRWLSLSKPPCNQIGIPPHSVGDGCIRPCRHAPTGVFGRGDRAPTNPRGIT